MKTEDAIRKEFVENALYRLDGNRRMVSIALESLTEEDIWKRPNESSNSIGNQILHLCGNITQYGIASLSGIADERTRKLEFSSKGGVDKKTLLSRLNKVVTKTKDNIIQLKDSQYLKKREVQGFTFSGIGVILHVVEHFSYHTGQIAFWTKILKNKDLGFYDGIDLTIKNND